MTTEPGAPHNDYDDDWRAKLLPSVSFVAVALIGLSGLSIFTGFGTEAMRIFGVCLVAGSFVMAALLWTRRFSHFTKSAIIVGSLAVSSVAGYVIGGFLPGASLAVSLTLVFAALLLGRKSLILMFAMFTILVIALTSSITTGFWEGPDPAGFNPQDAKNWFRTSFVSIIIWASTGFAVTFVIGTIEENLARRRAALASLREEMAERRAAEIARREAEAVATQAQKMEAVGQVAAAIAHDFNNALLVIKGWNEMRGRYDNDDREREATEAIEQATEHSAQLGKQLLTFSRKDIRTPKLLRLDQLITDTAESLRHLVGPSIELTLDTQPDGPVYADESQLKQLIFNLVINARDAIAGKGNIRISVSHISANEVEGFDPPCDRCVLLTVEDDGPGIEKTHQERVFEPFFTTKSSGKGTGLGLATVASIVAQSGGHVDLMSRPGETIFSVLFPTAEVEQPDKTVAGETILADKLGLRVLVLEDDSRARNIIASTLALNGNEVLECGDGNTAMSLLASEHRPFDLLCSDAAFPGDPLADILEAFERHSPEGKVLICSGYVQEELAIRKLESGEYAFLAKPFTGSELITRIRDILN